MFLSRCGFVILSSYFRMTNPQVLFFGLPPLPTHSTGRVSGTGSKNEVDSGTKNTYSTGWKCNRQAHFMLEPLVQRGKGLFTGRRDLSFDQKELDVSHTMRAMKESVFVQVRTKTNWVARKDDSFSFFNHFANT